jgi:hypothetical protein
MPTFTQSCPGCRYVLSAGAARCPRCMPDPVYRRAPVSAPRVRSGFSVTAVACALAACLIYGPVLLIAAACAGVLAVLRGEPGMWGAIAVVWAALLLTVVGHWIGV